MRFTAREIPVARVATALETATAPPGRLEPVTGRDDDFAVRVYATGWDPQGCSVPYSLEITRTTF